MDNCIESKHIYLGKMKMKMKKLIKLIYLIFPKFFSWTIL